MKKIKFLFRKEFWKAILQWQLRRLFLLECDYAWWRSRCKLIFKGKI